MKETYCFPSLAISDVFKEIFLKYSVLKKYLSRIDFSSIVFNLDKLVFYGSFIKLLFVLRYTMGHGYLANV